MKIRTMICAAPATTAAPAAAAPAIVHVSGHNYHFSELIGDDGYALLLPLVGCHLASPNVGIMSNMQDWSAALCKPV